MEEVNIIPIDPVTFEYQEYSETDNQLIVSTPLDTSFDKNTDYIEYYIYDNNQNIIFPSSTIPLLSYDVIQSDILLDPEKNISDVGFNVGVYNVVYSFYRKRLASDISQKYFISDISSDRTEVRLDSNIISDELMISSSLSFEQYRETTEYFVDFLLNFGNNQTVIANNIRLEDNEGVDPTILIKLYEPLPSNFNIKDELWVVEEISKPQAYEATFPFIPIIEDDFTYISGPNYNIDITQQTSKGGEIFSFNTLLQSEVTSSITQIKNLLNEKEININVDYSNYSNFVNFSSAQTRLENFVYKVGLIESASNQLSGFLDQVTSQTINAPSYSSSREILTKQIDNIIENFDGYEYFLYFNSGSQFSYPKVNTEPPFILASTGSTQALEWVGSSQIGNTYYGGQALSASNYDQDNRDWLFWSIPEYLRDDPDNQRYELFVDMVGQYYDNVWVYTKDVTNKFNADNRLDYGISKDLVADAIKDFAVKLYSSNFNTDDLFTAFLGLTPSGSAFPVVGITGSIGGAVNTPTGFEYVDTEISASNDIVPLNNVQKQVYKRIYHNIPYLLKTKGTIAGIRALITSYGIPDTILRINEFGGKDRNEAHDYDLKQDVFNYAFDTGPSATNYVSSSFRPNPTWGLSDGANNSPGTVQFRFKSAPIPTASSNVASSDIRYSQSLWSTDDGGNIMLEYTGSGFVSGSYSGSVVNPYDYYGTLKFVPAKGDDPSISASIFLPFFNGDWWSVQANIDTVGGGPDTILFAANEINGKVGFSGSDTANGADNSFYRDATKAFLNFNSPVTVGGKTYDPFSGSFQELRYFTFPISESKFFDYTVNPYSNESNTISSSPTKFRFNNELMFRADLGTQLDTGSRTSIHPRVTGSAIQITQSWNGDISTFFTSSAKWITNVEDIFQDQVPAGIKNRITNKMYAENLILAEAPYGFQTPTSSQATISSTTSDVISPMESIQQTSFVSQSYTPNVNYLEVGFSPSNQINDDINAQLGYFNLGDYIGDPRQISSSSYTYPDLDVLRNAYFEKYIRGYNVVDFIRLIKFFDNSLFKMIKDFTPARTSLASGVVVKQHLLERNRQRPALVTSSFHNYSGSVVNLPKDYSSGSSDQPQYATSGSAIYKFSGGPGGSFNRFNSITTYPSGSNGLGPDNRFFLTQSWSESFDYGAIDRSIINSTYFNQSSSQYISASYKGIRYGQIHSDQSEFYTGIFTGSYIQVEDGILNPDCEPYLNVSDTEIFYRPVYYSFNNTLLGSVDASTFIDLRNVPGSGYAWIGSSIDADGASSVKFIKLSNLSANSIEVADYLEQNTTLNIGPAEYFIEGVTNYGNHVLLNIKDSLDANVTSSIPYGGQEDFTLHNATGSYSASGTSDNRSQNIFDGSENNQNQTIVYWGNMDNNTVTTASTDVLGFFNPGEKSITAQDILVNPSAYGEFGGFTLKSKTPNTPLFFSASFDFVSFATGISNVITSSGIYASASSNLGAAYNQGFTMGGLAIGPANTSQYRPAPSITDLATSQFFTDAGGNFVNNLIQGNSSSWYDSTIIQTSTGGINSYIPPFFPASGPAGDANLATKPNENLAGNVQIKNAGTASLDWYFPALEFNQVSTPVPAPLAQNTALSASAIDGSFSNDDFVFTKIGASSPRAHIINSDGTGNNTNATLTNDQSGIIGIQQAALFDLATLMNGLSGGGLPTSAPSGANLTDVTFVVMYTLEVPAGANISASHYAVGANDGSSEVAGAGASTIRTYLKNETEGSTGTGATLYAGGYGNFNFTDGEGSGDGGFGGVDTWYVADGNNEIQITASYGLGTNAHLAFLDPSVNTSFNGGSSGNSQVIYFKPVIKGLEEGTVSYKFKNFKIITQFQFPAAGGGSQIITTGDYDALSWSQTVAGSTLLNNFISAGSQGSDATTPTDNDVTLRNNAAQSAGNQVDITAKLIKLSGSFNNNPSPNSSYPIHGYPQVITQSQTVTYTMTPGSGTGGKGGANDSHEEIVLFPDSPILDILHPYDADYWPQPQSGSTIVEAGDIFYIEYSMSNFVSPSSGTTTFNWSDSTGDNVALPAVINTGSKIFISQSVIGTGAGDPGFSASIQIKKSTDSNPIGNQIVSQPAVGNIATGFSPGDPINFAGTATITGSINLDEQSYSLGDTFRMAIDVSRSFSYGLHVTNYSMSIFNSSSRWAEPLPTGDNGTNDPQPNNFKVPSLAPVIIPTFYGSDVLPFQFAVDCQPLLNNFSSQRTNPYLYDIDYNFQGDTIYYSSSLAPVNFLQILSGSAVKAAVPESNYTELRSINPRYNGAKSTSQELNVWSIGDVGTYGKNPTIELRDAFFGYFNDLDDPYPNINNLTRINLNYLIDEQANALPPSLNQLSIDTFEQVFPNTTTAKIAARSGKGQYKTLGEPAEIERLMQYVTPIMYSQNSGDNYTNVIPLSGSGYISRYDNDDEATQIFSRFNVNGPCSVDTSTIQQSVDYVINPSSTDGLSDPTPGNNLQPYTSSGDGGAADYAASARQGFTGYAQGEELPNQQIVTISHTFVTTFVSETRRVRDELQFDFHMYTGSISQTIANGPDLATERSFNLESITCNVHTDDGRVTSLGDVTDYGWFEIRNIVDYQRVKRRVVGKGLWRTNRWKYSRVPVPTGGIKCTVDWEMYETLWSLGLMRENKPKGSSGVKALEWTIKANSGNYNIKGGDQIQWRLDGEFKDSRGGYAQGYFFPIAYENEKAFANIQGVGAYDHLLDEANTAQAPFWVFTGSSGGGSTVLDQQFLVMSSSNMNEAYGTSFRQADLEYLPAPSEYFPNGIEPKTTRFDNIEYNLELEIGDEIRFGNNENFTYKIIEVFAPEANNGTTDRKNRLKVKLDRPVDISVNKDFFLVRRNIVNPNSLYLNTPFPYESLASASISTGIKEFSGSFGLTGSFINLGGETGSSTSIPGTISGSLSSSFSNLEITDTPGILYPDFPTEYLVQSASIIVNDLISKGIIES